MDEVPDMDHFLDPPDDDDDEQVDDPDTGGCGTCGRGSCLGRCDP